MNHESGWYGFTSTNLQIEKDGRSRMITADEIIGSLSEGIAVVDVEERPSVSLKGIDRNIKTYAVKGRKAEADKPLRLSHPQGVHIDLSPLNLRADDRQLIASQLKALAQRLEQH